LSKSFIIIFGFILKLLPGFILQLFCLTAGVFTILLFKGRRELVLNNLDQALVNSSLRKRLVLAIKTIERTIEQGLLALVWPFLRTKLLKLNFQINDKSLDLLRLHSNEKHGVLWLIPHFCHADAISFLPELIGPGNGVHALYRPLKNFSLNEHVKNSRERFGMKTIDRKDGGMLKTLKVLKRGNTLAMLFDQNAGGAGTRLKFMGRECSCTTLPDILFDKYKPKVLFVYTRRTGFWKSSFEVEEVGELEAGKLLIEQANCWLEEKLKNDQALRESWLWMHQRWKANVGQSRKGRIR
jgi:lauroyl/myristoyl acyltransferase